MDIVTTIQNNQGLFNLYQEIGLILFIILLINLIIWLLLEF